VLKIGKPIFYLHSGATWEVNSDPLMIPC